MEQGASGTGASKRPRCAVLPQSSMHVAHRSACLETPCLETPLASMPRSPLHALPPQVLATMGEVQRVVGALDRQVQGVEREKVPRFEFEALSAAVKEMRGLRDADGAADRSILIGKSLPGSNPAALFLPF